MPEISIIVPVYNTEKYLHKCVESILAQTFVNFECILVDDGSTDSSPAICDEYAAKDNRITVVRHAENRGAGAARNTGFDFVRGIWIGFADSDDWCDPGMFQFLYDNAVKYDADVSVCGYRYINEETGEICENKYSLHIKKHKDILYDNQPGEILAALLDKRIDCLGTYKLIKAACIEQLKLRFDTSVNFAEDLFFCVPLLKGVKRVFYSTERYYNYLIRRHSISHQSFLKRTSSLAGFDRMITCEQNKKIKRKMILFKVDFVSDACYIEAENYGDDRYKILSSAAKELLFRILLLNLPVKARLSRFFCVLFPGVFLFLRQKYRKIKGSAA
jgi:glycosyltransferase involved in cell wall biosynthesis